MKLVNKKRIAILLGVYNGGKYLAEQLDSLLAQTNDDWTIYIRDDGSSDNSVDLISNYHNKYQDLISVINDDRGNLKSRDNFFQLLNSVDSEYYMFCDQDDVWLPEKIQLTFDKMKFNEIHNASKPIVIFTDLKIVDNSLNLISTSFWRHSKINPEILKDFKFLSVCNAVTGCTMMINKEAYNNSLPVLPESLMHDCWISLKTIANNGIIDFVKEPTILYRQHDNNVIGVETKNGYYVNKLKTAHLILKQNRLNLKMVNKIKSTNIFSYLYFKIIYLIKR